MWHQTYGYLPSHSKLLLYNWYQIILLRERGTCVWTTCPRLLSSSGMEARVASQCLNHHTPGQTYGLAMLQKSLFICQKITKGTTIYWMTTCTVPFPPSNRQLLRFKPLCLTSVCIRTINIVCMYVYNSSLYICQCSEASHNEIRTSNMIDWLFLHR